MASRENAQQISKLTFFLEKLTGQFDKYFRHKRGALSEYSQSEERKQERREEASHQSLASPREEQPKANSPQRPNPREHTTVEVEELDDEIRPAPAGKDTSKASNDRPERRREEKDRGAPQQPSAIHINISSNHDSSTRPNPNPPQPQPAQGHPAPPPAGPQEAQSSALNSLPLPAVGLPAPAHYAQPNPAPRNNDFYQIYHPPRHPVQGCNSRSCILLLAGLILLLGGIIMVIFGTIQLNKNAVSQSQWGKCCYVTYNIVSGYSYGDCYSPRKKGSWDLGMILIGIGIFNTLTGMILLFNSHRVYQNNNHFICCQNCC